MGGDPLGSGDELKTQHIGLAVKALTPTPIHKTRNGSVAAACNSDRRDVRRGRRADCLLSALGPPIYFSSSIMDYQGLCYNFSLAFLTINCLYRTNEERDADVKCRELIKQRNIIVTQVLSTLHFFLAETNGVKLTGYWCVVSSLPFCPYILLGCSLGHHQSYRDSEHFLFC